MRKLIVLEHISLDGVIQAPGGPDEDTSDGFAYGGWIAPYSDTIVGTALRKQMSLPFDLLLGRKTFQIWEPYWPQHGDIWPGVNTATKYVASNTMTASEWQPSVFLSGDIAKEVAQLKQEPGPDLHVDTFWLMIYPVTLGVGKRLFADGTLAAAFRLTESHVGPSGIIVVNYERAGAVVV